MLARTAPTQDLIGKFLDQKRLAIVGVSREASDFTRRLFAEMRERGYDVVPVNPAAESIDGIRCYPRVQDIYPPVQTVLIMTSPTVTDQVVRDCAEAGVSLVWMHRGEGIGAVSQTAIDYCNRRGIGVVAGLCPYMFLDNPGLIHRAHGFIKKLTGTYPTRLQEA